MDEKPQVKKLKLDKTTVKDLQAAADGSRAALAPPTEADSASARRGTELAPPTR